MKKGFIKPAINIEEDYVDQILYLDDDFNLVSENEATIVKIVRNGKVNFFIVKKTKTGMLFAPGQAEKFNPYHDLMVLHTTKVFTFVASSLGV